MRDLVEQIAFSLVDKTEKVTVEIDEALNVIHIYADKSEIGRLIGKQGRIAKAIRAIVKAGGAKEHKKYMVEIDER